MLTRSKVLVLVAGISGLMALLTPVAHAITISVSEVRDGAAFVKGSDAGRKQEIFWLGDYVTTANGKGNFSFEGELPENCTPFQCVGTLTIGDESDAESIPVTFSIVPLTFEPAELKLLDERQHSPGGDAVRAVGFVVVVVDGMEETRVVSGGADAHLRNWTLDLSQQIDRSLANIIYVIDVSTDGYIVATGEGGWSGHAGADTFRIWDAVDMELTQTQRPAVGYVYSLALSPDNEWAIATGFYGELAVHQTSTLELYATTATKKKRTKAIDFSPDGSLVVSASTGGIQLRSFPQDDDCVRGNCELDLLLTLSHSGSWSFSTVFAPYSTSEYIELASGTDSGTIKIWTIENNLDTNSTVPFRSVDSDSVYSLAWSPDGTMIVAGGSGDITVYDSTDLSILFQKVDAHAGRVNDVAVSPDGFMIVSGGEDGALKLWMIPPP